MQQAHAGSDGRSLSALMLAGADVRARANELTLLAILCIVVMLFAGFTAAYLIRRTGADWQRVPLPGMLWVNTAVLLASSVTIELARRGALDVGLVSNLPISSIELAGWKPAPLRRWLAATIFLGVLFLCGQLLAWRGLAVAGVFLPTHPHSSFFYMLSGVHAVHLLGGMVALVYAVGRPSVLRLAAFYWHFVGGVWLYVLAMLNVL